MEKEITLDLDKIMLKVYNKIALWNNEDGTPKEKQDRLKFVSHDIIETIINDMLENMDVKTKIKTLPAEKHIEKKTGIFTNFFKK